MAAAGRIAMLAAVGVGVGSASALAAIGFVEAVEALNAALLVSAYARVEYAGAPSLLGLATVLGPGIGGLAVGLVVQRGVAERRPLGPPDAILAVQTRRSLPRLGSGLASTLAALISLGCGASVGQYGPLVYLGAMIGGLAGRLEERMRDLGPIAIACGAAAAIATAFNAPIAGLIFAHEVLLRHYSLRAFAPVAVAAATGYVIANVVFARAPLFRVEFDGVAHGHEFLLFALEGGLAALLAAGFIGMVLRATELAARLPGPASLRPAAAGVCLGLVALAVAELAMILSAKLAMTALCIGFGFVGGVFSPALLIGILAGALFGMGVGEALPGAQSGIVPYAICGMMAVTSPVIGAPLTTILIVFELTRNYDLTIAAMVAVVFSNLVAHGFVGRSLFDLQLRRRGFDLSLGRDRAILGLRAVGDLARADFTRAAPTETAAELADRLTAAERSEAVMTDAEGRFLGLVRGQDLRAAPPETAAGALVRRDAMAFEADTTLWDAMVAIRGFLGEAVPVLDRDRRVIGVVPESAVIAGYMEAVDDLRREENAAG